MGMDSYRIEDAPFRDDPHRNLIHNVRVWISGVEVSDRLTSSVSFDIIGRGGHNTASFSLSNAGDGFIITTDNTKNIWRLGGPEGEHSEEIKWQMYQHKTNSSINGVDKATGQRRWPLTVGSSVLHSLDTVFIAERYPYSAERLWIPRFKGYMSDGGNFKIDALNNHSSVQISCYDIRALMAFMRVQMNYLILNEAAAVSAEGVGRNNKSEAILNAFDPIIISGLLSDLQLPTNLSTFLANLSFEETIRLLIVGGHLTDGRLDPTNGTSDAAQPDFLSRLCDHLAGRRSTAKVVPPSSSPTQQVAGANVLADGSIDVKAIGRIRNDLGEVRWPIGSGNDPQDIELLERWHRLTLYGTENGGRPWTDQQVQDHGELCTWNGFTAPHASQLYMLMPSTGSGMRALTDYTVDSGSSTRSWSSRLSILNDYVEKIDYQWFVTGSGDLVFEFPMYDMLPSHFGEWEEAFSIRSSGEGKDFSFADDKPEVPTAIQATGAYDARSLEGGSDLFADAILQGNGLSLTNTRVTLVAPVLAARLGMRIEQVSFPYVTDVCRLRQFAVLTMQRKLAEANSLSVSLIYRPLFMPNRPVFVAWGEIERMGLIQSINESESRLYPDMGGSSTNISVQYVRRRDEKGEFNLITGATNMPLSFNGKGPLINPSRGIITESFSPGDDVSKISSPCDDSSIVGRPNGSVESAILLPADVSECSISEDDLTPQARQLWRALKVQAASIFKFDLRLTCTHNKSNKPHESIEPYGHNNLPSSAFDVAIFKGDGSGGTETDYNELGKLAESLGLGWGGSVPASSNSTLAEAQAIVMKQANYHADRMTPYIYGGNGPDDRKAFGWPGIDCAGLVVDCYRKAGLLSGKQDPCSGELRKLFPEVKGRIPQPGDLAFYNSGKRPWASATHVVIIASSDLGTKGYPIIGASGPGPAAKSVELAVQNGWKVKRIPGHLYRKDFVGFGSVFDKIARTTEYPNHFYVR